MTDSFVSIPEKLNSLGIVMPSISLPAASYVHVRQAGSLLVVSGQLSTDISGNLIKGAMGDGVVDIDAGCNAAKRAAINVLARLHEFGVELRLIQCVRLGVLVASLPDFFDQPKVADGASSIMLAVLGKDNGSHARAAFGVSALPLGALIEVEATFSILDR